MCIELYGEVPENEPKDITAIPGIPDGSERECISNGSKDEIVQL